MSNIEETKKNEEVTETSISVLKEVYEQRLADKDKQIEELKKQHAKEIRSILTGEKVEEEETPKKLTFEEEVIQLLNKKFNIGE